MNLAQLVRARRLELGFSQAEVCRRSKLSITSISGIETGKACNPRPATQQEIAAVLKLSIPVIRAAIAASNLEGGAS